MAELKELQKIVADFRDKRKWQRFHKPKDLAINLSLESAEVLEHFIWRSNKELEAYTKKKKAAISEELADVLYSVLLLCHDLDIDIEEAFVKKMSKNNKKYPLAKAGQKFSKFAD